MPASYGGQPCQDMTVVARTWADIDRRARLVIDCQRLVIWLNASARGMVTAGNALSIRNRMVTFASGALEEAFDAFIASLQTTGPSTIEFPAAGSGENIFVKAFRIAVDHGPLFCLELHTGRGDSPITYVNLESALGLTRTEHRIALALLDGGQPRDIAVTHRISLETVRTHVKNIYLKVGVAKNGAFHAALRHFQR